MSSKYLSEHPFRVIGWTLVGLILLLVILEGWRYAVKPSIQSKDEILDRTLNEVSTTFVDVQRELLDNTWDLAQTLQSQLEQQRSRQPLYESLREYPQLWGSALYRGNQPIVWNNFSLEPFQEIRFSIGPKPSVNTKEANLEPYVTVKKENNVLLWIAHVGFTVATEKGEAEYHLYTTRRIEQNITLPIGNSAEYRLFEEASAGKLHSVNMAIYDPLPTNYADYRVLQSLSEDSVGVVYGIANDFEEIQTEWQQSNQFWRAVYTLFCFIVIGFILYLWVDRLSTMTSLFYQILIISIGWVVFNQINIAEVWLPPLLTGFQEQQILSYQMLCNFVVGGIFFLLTAFTLQRKLSIVNFRLRSSSFFTGLFVAFTVGLINMAAIVFTLRACYTLAFTSSIPMLTLRVFPATGTLLFYLALGIMLLALIITLLALNRFLLRSCEDQYKLATAICITGFVFGLLIAQLYIPEIQFFNWTFNLSVVFFGLIFGLSFLYFKFPYSIPHASPLRNAAIYSFLISIVGSTLIYQAQTRNIDLSLANTVQEYTEQQDKKAEDLTQQILARLQKEIAPLGQEELQNRLSYIQAQFTQTIESVIHPGAGIYSYDLRLINPEKELLADYSTNLNSPEWVDDYNLRHLETVMDIQQINKNSVRPIVQQPELEDAENYQTFARGWIPIFGEDEEEPIAWILCSVYQERPNFNKPMRAVLAAQNYQDWEDSYTIQQYENNRLSKKINQGVGAHYPVYSVLQTGEQQALQQDSTVFYTSSEDNETYRNLLVKQPDSSVIKTSTVMPGYQNILFSFFRLTFTLLVTGFVILLINQIIQNGRLTFFGNNEQFRYRILDSFLLATLVFLVLLIFVTHYAIERQNQEMVQEQLFEKLESITTAAENNPAVAGQIDRSETFSLDSLTAPLNVDASLYQNQLVTRSTTPQIYQQYLLPSAMPYSVYSDLFLSQKRDALSRVMLGNQELLIGYRSILADDNTPSAAIAIPTFIKSPKFTNQLLETTSYLIILYIVVFGLFIIGTTIIARQLTRPLHHIQQGLNKISKGDLDTKIPATSNDEIGSLAKAYNQMVSRLSELQEELATAEREAAWKEMAQQVAHEIKNPLTPMKLNIQHLERQLASGDYTIEELKEKIKTITQNLTVQIESLNNIASDFSKFSKPVEEEQFEPININDLIHSVTDLYKHDDQTSLRTACEAYPATVYGAEDELRRVIINLVKNAHESMPDGGTISLKTFSRNGSLFVEVEDDGEGIAEENKPKIFVPNFSTKSSGTGLGLAICKKVIEAHEGSISFASIKGKGTTFVIKLPQNGTG